MEVKARKWSPPNRKAWEYSLKRKGLFDVYLRIYMYTCLVLQKYLYIFSNTFDVFIVRCIPSFIEYGPMSTLLLLRPVSLAREVRPYFLSLGIVPIGQNSAHGRFKKMSEPRIQTPVFTFVHPNDTLVEHLSCSSELRGFARLQSFRR